MSKIQFNPINAPVSASYLKAKAKEAKYEQKRQQRYNEQERKKSREIINKMTDEERFKLQQKITIMSHALELFNDGVDDLANMGLVGGKNLLIQAQESLLQLQGYFIEQSMKRGEAVEMERIKQQKLFEELFINLIQAEPEKLEKLITTIKSETYEAEKETP